MSIYGLKTLEKIVNIHGREWTWVSIERKYYREANTKTDRISVVVRYDVVSKDGWIVDVIGISKRWHTRAQLARFAKTRCLAMLLAERYVSRVRNLLIKLMKDRQYADGDGWPTRRSRIFGCCKARRDHDCS